MKLLVKKGKTSKIVQVFVQDSSSSTGAGLSGLTSSSSGLVCYRSRTDDGNAVATQLSLSGGTRGTWSSGGFVEKDATNMKGVYELGLDNAGIASGADQVIYYLSGATNMAPCVLEIQLVDFDPQDSVHLGLTALPNTACTTNASLITSGTGTDQLQVASGLASTDTKQINGVATTSVTTINANIGTSQPINFTGTSTSALVKCDVEDIAGIAVNTDAAQIGVNIVNLGGSVGTFSSGKVAVTLASTDVSGNVAADVQTIKTQAITCSGSVTVSAYVGTTAAIAFNSGYVNANVAQWGTHNVSYDSAGTPNVNVARWGGNAAATTNVNGVPVVDVSYWSGTIIASPATAGIPEVNIKNINDISTSSVTTVNANIGTTQPTNFSGTGSSALVKSDVESILGTASAGAAGYVGIDWSQINTPSATVNLSNTTVSQLTNNNDKSGYSLSQTFPANFASLGITTGGHIANIDTITNYVPVDLSSLAMHSDIVSLSSQIGTPQQSGTAITLPANPPSGFINSSAIAAGAMNGKGDWLTSSNYGSIASTIFTLDLSTLSGEPEFCLLNAERKLRNTWGVSGTTLTVYKEDGSTVAYTQSLTINSGASPITGITS